MEKIKTFLIIGWPVDTYALKKTRDEPACIETRIHRVSYLPSNFWKNILSANRKYCPTGCADLLDENGVLYEGTWYPHRVLIITLMQCRKK